MRASRRHSIFLIIWIGSSLLIHWWYRHLNQEWSICIMTLVMVKMVMSCWISLRCSMVVLVTILTTIMVTTIMCLITITITIVTSYLYLTLTCSQWTSPYRTSPNSNNNNNKQHANPPLQPNNIYRYSTHWQIVST